jgi:hypothetical protein
VTPRFTLAILALLSQTGCVAAIPLATQLVTGTNSAAQLCSLATFPGQTASLCDRLSLGMTSQATQQPAQTGTRTLASAAAR